MWGKLDFISIKPAPYHGGFPLLQDDSLAL